MPAHRTPTPILMARGSFDKNPQRAKARESEPVVTDPIGPPPKRFLPDENGFNPQERKDHLALWYELIADAAPGVLNRSHRWHVESACILKRKEIKGLAKTTEIVLLNKLLTQMGMNPAAQSTVNAAGFQPASGNGTFSKLHGKAQAIRSG